MFSFGTENKRYGLTHVDIVNMVIHQCKSFRMVLIKRNKLLAFSINSHLSRGAYRVYESIHWISEIPSNFQSSIPNRSTRNVRVMILFFAYYS